MTNLYSIYDRVERKYSFPFSSNTDLGAVRRMKSADIFKNVSMSDFELYRVGTFDEDGIEHIVLSCAPIYKIDWNLDVKSDEVTNE